MKKSFLESNKSAKEWLLSEAFYPRSSLSDKSGLEDANLSEMIIALKKMKYNSLSIKPNTKNHIYINQKFNPDKIYLKNYSIFFEQNGKKGSFDFKKAKNIVFENLTIIFELPYFSFEVEDFISENEKPHGMWTVEVSRE